jgi:hypothetical protein
LDPLFLFVTGIVVGAALHAAVRPAVRKLSGDYFFRDGETLEDEGHGIDSPAR